MQLITRQFVKLSEEEIRAILLKHIENSLATKVKIVEISPQIVLLSQGEEANGSVYGLVDKTPLEDVISNINDIDDKYTGVEVQEIVIEIVTDIPSATPSPSTTKKGNKRSKS